MESNETQGVCYAQPRSLADRVVIANDFVRRCSFPIPILIDDEQNAADQSYAGWPERLYVIDDSNKIAYKGKTGPFGYEPVEVEAWLKARFPRAQ